MALNYPIKYGKYAGLNISIDTWIDLRTAARINSHVWKFNSGDTYVVISTNFLGLTCKVNYRRYENDPNVPYKDYKFTTDEIAVPYNFTACNQNDMLTEAEFENIIHSNNNT